MPEPSGQDELGEHIEIITPEKYGGTRIDQLLVTLLPNHSRSFIQRLIKTNRVQLNGKPVKASVVARVGAHIAIDVPAPISPTLTPENLPLDIIHEDADIIVINKPSGMVVHPAAGHTSGTLVNALLYHAGGLSGVGGELRPGIVHRLDKGTSGLLVAAKHDQAHRELGRQFRQREVKKEYVALVWGGIQAGRKINLPIGRHRTERQRMSTSSTRSRTAITEIVRAEPLDGLTLIGVMILTGRTHQIRVHLAAIGHPIVGDSVYGGTKHRLAPKHRTVASLSRPFLHASRLAFKHPRDRRQVEFRAKLPKDLRCLLRDLRKQAQS